MDAVEQFDNVMSADRNNDVARIVGDAGQQLRRFIRARVPSEADAEDILHDVWHKLVTTLEGGPIERVTAWLYTVARNRIIDQYRNPPPASLEAMADEAEAEDPAADSSFEIPEFILHRDNSPGAGELRDLFWEQLRSALAELPREQRQVFVWHELEGRSYQDIIGLTGENLNTLLARKRYAVRHLRRRFAWLRDEFIA